MEGNYNANEISDSENGENNNGNVVMYYDENAEMDNSNTDVNTSDVDENDITGESDVGDDAGGDDGDDGDDVNRLNNENVVVAVVIDDGEDEEYNNDEEERIQAIFEADTFAERKEVYQMIIDSENIADEHGEHKSHFQTTLNPDCESISITFQTTSNEDVEVYQSIETVSKDLRHLPASENFELLRLIIREYYSSIGVNVNQMQSE